jgi:hypothetical protein
MVAQYGHAVADDLTADPVVRRQPLALQDPTAIERPWQRNNQIRRPPSSAGLYDVLDLILDKGIVIDAFVRVSLVGIELLTVDLRVVIASVDTYLLYAEGVERLNVDERSGAKKLPDMVGSGAKKGMMAHGAKKLGEAMKGGGDDKGSDEGEEGEEEDSGQKKGLAGALTHGVRHILKKGVGGILHNIKGDGEEQDDEGQEKEDDDGGDEAEARDERHGRDREDRGREDRGNRGGSRTMAKAGSRR